MVLWPSIAVDLPLQSTRYFFHFRYVQRISSLFAVETVAVTMPLEEESGCGAWCECIDRLL